MMGHQRELNGRDASHPPRYSYKPNKQAAGTPAPGRRSRRRTGGITGGFAEYTRAASISVQTDICMFGGYYP